MLLCARAQAMLGILRKQDKAPTINDPKNVTSKTQADRVVSIPVIGHDDMEWAEGHFWSVPTRYGSVASQARAFIDTLGPLWMAGKLADNTFTATTSAQNAHGGQETALIGLYTTLMHWGAIIVAPGYTDPSLFAAGGNPYGVSTNAGAFSEAGRAAVAHQAKRRVEFTTKIAG